ncbi:MAG: Conserved rane protein of unknown function [Modestobacter sp.]|jgi:hypothetical protein|nr:Conserved rane protein of unknown function [Modestobacter sp.]MCW2510793.1 Conserved rane protein of unknown function [Modestobacter sp.]
MSQPNSGEYSARSLAEILREHGLETELGTRPGRRRRTSDDPEVTGRSPRVEPAPPAPRPQTPGQAPGAARSSAPARTPGQNGSAPRSPAAASPAPAQARSSAPVWSDQPAAGPRPAAGLAGPASPVREPTPARVPSPAPSRETRDSVAERMSSTGPVGGRADVAPPPVRHGRRKSDTGASEATEEPITPQGRGPSTSAIPSLGAAARGRQAEAHPVTGPIPVRNGAQRSAADEPEEPLTGRESAVAWARFAGELVVALAVGVGLYFAFTVLWELMPYVALVAAPVTVTALVAGVATWRQRQGQGALGVRLLAVLLLAGTVLVIAPAAGLLAG